TQQGGLAAARRTDDAHDLALGYREIDPAQHLGRAIAMRDPAQQEIHRLRSLPALCLPVPAQFVSTKLGSTRRSIVTVSGTSFSDLNQSSWSAIEVMLSLAPSLMRIAPSRMDGAAFS